MRPKTQIGKCVVNGCANRQKSRHLCHTHYCRLIRTGSVSRLDWRGKFEARVLRAKGCWPWCGAVSSSGYGRFSMGYKKVRAHRASYEFYVGPIPDGMQVLHRCDNPICVNPEHLFLGTHIDNMRDMENKGRAKWIQENLSRMKS